MEDIINSKGKKWQGYWEQGGYKGAMTFDKFFIEKGVIKGAGTDTVGEFEIDGKQDGENIEFNKQYIGKHLVIYIGKYDGRVIQGKWHIGRQNDNFTIWRADVAPWKGVFYEQGKAYAMVLELGDEKGMLQGSGEDYLGTFGISGEFEENGKVALRKEYVGEPAQILEGKVVAKDSIRGTYETPNGTCMFSMEKCPAEQYEEVLDKLQTD